MPAPKPDKPLLTAKERERLSDKNLDPNIRKRNDMIVRNKILSWLNKSDDVYFALEHLQTRTLKKELSDNDVYGLFWVGLKLLKILDFAPVENLSGVPVVSKPIDSTGDPKKDTWVRQATESDFERNYTIELIRDELKKMISINDLYKQYRFKKITPGPGKWFYDSYKQEKQSHEATISASDKIIKRDPDNAEAWYKRGIALWGLEKDEAALESLNKAIDLPSTFWTFASAIGAVCEILNDLGRHAEAEQVALVYHFRLINSNPSDPYNFVDLGGHFRSRCRYKEAVECYDKAITLDPSNDRFWTDKGETLYEMGKFKKAIQCLDKAIELRASHSSERPLSPTPYEYKGKALNELGFDNEAKICLSKAKELEDKIIEAMETKKTTAPFKEK